ncbi:MAG: ATP-binding protein [Syntrophomonas sp.]
MQHLHVSLKNKLEEIPALAQAIENFAEANNLPDHSIFQVNLCLDELLTNTISYGFPEGGEHEISVAVTLEGETLVVGVRDDGLAFNPLEQSEPDTAQGIEERPIGGLGIHLVRNMMDEIEYRRESGQNVLVMKKQLNNL